MEITFNTDNLKECENIEAIFDIIIKHNIERIKTGIETLESPGIKQISHNISVINLSNLQNSVWSPEYYSQYHQAKLFGDMLKGSQTIKSLKAKLKDAFDTGKIKSGAHYYRINEQTRNWLIEEVFDDEV